MDELDRLNQSPLPFATLLGIHFTSATTERVTAELLVRDDLCTRPAILHGGAIMAFADTLGAAATILNLRDGAGTTTIEVKDELSRPGAGGHEDPRGDDAGASWPAHHGLANPGYNRGWSPGRVGDADATGDRSAGLVTKEVGQSA